MLVPLTVVLLALCAVLALFAVYHLLRRRLIDDRLLAVAAALELALLVQLVVGLSHAGQIGGADGATFVAYLFSAVVVPPFVVFLAIKEKTGWAMGVILVGAFVCAILVGRLEQIWGLAHG